MPRGYCIFCLLSGELSRIPNLCKCLSRFDRLPSCVLFGQRGRLRARGSMVRRHRCRDLACLGPLHVRLDHLLVQRCQLRILLNSLGKLAQVLGGLGLNALGIL